MPGLWHLRKKEKERWLDVLSVVVHTFRATKFIPGPGHPAGRVTIYAFPGILQLSHQLTRFVVVVVFLLVLLLLLLGGGEGRGSFSFSPSLFAGDCITRKWRKVFTFDVKKIAKQPYNQIVRFAQRGLWALHLMALHWISDDTVNHYFRGASTDVLCRLSIQGENSVSDSRPLV